MGGGGSKASGGGSKGVSRGDVRSVDISGMTLVVLALQVEKGIILPTMFVIKDGYILIKEELMVVTIEQINSVPQAVVILQRIVLAEVGKEEEELVVLVALIGKVEVAKIPHIQANNILINL